MTPEAMEEFNGRKLESQYALFGRPAVYVDPDGKEYPVVMCRSSVKNRKQLRDGGFKMMHDSVCRIRMDRLPVTPRTESHIVQQGRRFRVKEVVDSDLSGEWKLGLASAS